MTSSEENLGGSAGRPVVLVTGGGRGIGAATAERAAVAGYRVAVNYARDWASADRVVTAIERGGGEAVGLRGDVGDPAAVAGMFAAIDARWGRLDALVNNAGIVSRQGRVDDVEADRLARLFAVNVTGSFLCAGQAVRRMSTARGGHGGVIVNLSSAAARLGAAGEYVDYAASKAAIDTLTIGLAREVAAEGIRVNAVRPGIIDTQIHADGGEPGRAQRLGPTVPIGRAGRPAEVAEAIVWLLSDAASFVTGAILDVSGGR